MHAKAPCGADATIKHFKVCQHAECKAKLDEWNRLKTETANSLRKFFKPKHEVIS